MLLFFISNVKSQIACPYYCLKFSRMKVMEYEGICVVDTLKPDDIDLIQSDSMAVQPGKTLTISCQVSGYSITNDSYVTRWVRQHV